MYFSKLAKTVLVVGVSIMGALLLLGLHLLLCQQGSIVHASLEQSPDGAMEVATQSISGTVIVPTDAYSFSVQVYTAPLDVDFVIISATATWSNDWHTPSVSETSQSSPNIVEIPYQGGVGCDFLYSYEENNFARLWLKTQDQFDQDSASIIIGPGKSVAIAGSDCGLHDDFHAHIRVAWTAIEQHQIFLPLVVKDLHPAEN